MSKDETRAVILTGAGGGIGGIEQEIVCDLRDEEAFRAVLADLVGDEPVRGLVNCAGIFPIERFLESDSASWRTQIDVNFLAPLTACHVVLPALIEAGWGRIVNVSSDSSRVGAARLAVYTGTKGGLLSFSKSLAQEVGRTGVTVNCISPGTIVGENTDLDMATKLARKIPLGRLGVPDDIAPAVGFLMSEGAGYITGQVISVGGGLTMVG
jgi:2-hydroxycyclohexanecarboxyl-CoA dehydrogenase